MNVFNRYTQELEREKIPNEASLFLLYTTWFGRLLLKLFIKRVWLSKLIGRWMNWRISKNKILPFAHRYRIDLDLFEKKLEDYKHFNDFFYRKFKPGVRPVCGGDDSVCFPAEGRHMGFKNFDEDQTLFIKGNYFNIESLVNNNAIAEHFRGGTCVVSRLSPVDYHRFHFPCDGVPQKSYCINGTLLSVNPIALQSSFRTFCENKRWVTLLRSDTFGQVLIVEVSATFIGSVNQTFTPLSKVRKGDEKGFFAFGGSTVVTLFEHGRVELSDDLIYCTQRGFELYAHVGDFMGQVVNTYNGCYAEITEKSENFIK